MGFNLEGLACRVPEEKVIADLRKETLKKHPDSKLFLEKEISFEDWMRYKPGDNVLDIYSTDKGTLISASHKILFNFFHLPFSENFDLYKFDLSETSMHFRFEVSKNGDEHQVMTVNDSNGRRVMHDPILPVPDGDVSMVLFPNFVRMITDFDFHEIDLADKAKRYLFTNFNKEEYYFV
jgi:hypothetical protein